MEQKVLEGEGGIHLISLMNKSRLFVCDCVCFVCFYVIVFVFLCLYHSVYMLCLDFCVYFFTNFLIKFPTVLPVSFVQFPRHQNIKQQIFNLLLAE